ncbi:MAG: AmmeMemoRadiSam system radical SAM enzyme [bacterium]|nr:AmmeMemoRadiSam system radical SAM enzyme [bacterium]
MVEAREYISLDHNRVQCQLCPHHCMIAPNKSGICGIRKNIDGKLYALMYARASSVSLDPIEKKPLYHFYPGSQILSMGTYGCNFRCPWCQNWTISQEHDGPTHTVPPETAVTLGSRQGSIGISYTYNEPLIWFEYVYDTAKLAKEKGLVNVVVTNGYINAEPLQQLLPYIDAMNIDLKSFSAEFYKKYCGGTLDAVLQTIELAIKANVHVELTTLLIPTLNDNEQELIAMVDWIAKLNDTIPLHFSRYFPQYQCEVSPTPIATLKKARQIALQKLKYVFLGNVHDPESDSTFCPACHNLLIKREGYWTSIIGIKDKRCSRCSRQVDIVL